MSSSILSSFFGPKPPTPPPSSGTSCNPPDKLRSFITFININNPIVKPQVTDLIIKNETYTTTHILNTVKLINATTHSIVVYTQELKKKLNCGELLQDTDFKFIQEISLVQTSIVAAVSAALDKLTELSITKLPTINDIYKIGIYSTTPEGQPTPQAAKYTLSTGGRKQKHTRKSKRRRRQKSNRRKSRKH